MESALTIVVVAALMLQFGVIMGQQLRINRQAEQFMLLDTFLFVMMRVNHLIPPSQAEIRREAEKALAKVNGEGDT